MLILAVEQSSDTGSVAILNDDHILGEREWDGLVLRSCGLFACLKDLLAAVALNLKDISHYVIDVGPGSYSGLRSSCAAVRAFTLSGKQPVYALTSAETLAFEIMQEFSVNQVQVVGDARRQQLWTCLYKKSGNMPIAQSTIQLVPENEFSPALGSVIVSPDWKRLQSKLMYGDFPPQADPPTEDKDAAGPAAHALPTGFFDQEKVGRGGLLRRGQALGYEGWIPAAPSNLRVIADGNTILLGETRVPKAGCLGKLAYQKIQLNIPSEPLRPIYLHAAVRGVKRDS